MARQKKEEWRFALPKNGTHSFKGCQQTVKAYTHTLSSDLPLVFNSQCLNSLQTTVITTLWFPKMQYAVSHASPFNNNYTLCCHIATISVFAPLMWLKMVSNCQTIEGKLR